MSLISAMFTIVFCGLGVLVFVTGPDPYLTLSLFGVGGIWAGVYALASGRK